MSLFYRTVYPRQDPSGVNYEQFKKPFSSPLFFQFPSLNFIYRFRCISCQDFSMIITETCTTILKRMKLAPVCMLHPGFLPCLLLSFHQDSQPEYLVREITFIAVLSLVLIGRVVQPMACKELICGPRFPLVVAAPLTAQAVVTARISRLPLPFLALCAPAPSRTGQHYLVQLTMQGEPTVQCKWGNLHPKRWWGEESMPCSEVNKNNLRQLGLEMGKDTVEVVVGQGESSACPYRAEGACRRARRGMTSAFSAM